MRNVSLSALLACSAALYGQANFAEAQEQPLSEEADASEDLRLSTVQVEGFRSSLEEALETKRDADSILDGISSEGIGRFPDLNLGESLQRVTGVQIERGERRRAEIAVRGLPRKFSLVRVNNQAMASPDLNNAFSFGVFESSIFSGADVIKSPTAAMDDGGLSGIVNMKTARALDFTENNLSVGAGLSYEDLPEETYPGFNLKGNYLFSENFGATFALGFSSPDFKRNQNQITDYDPDDNDIQVADDFRYQSTSSSGDRISMAGGLEYRASPELTLGLNGVFAEYDQTSVRDTLRIRNCDDTAGDIVGDTAITSTHSDCRFEAGSRIREDFDSTWAITGDAEWVNDDWRATGIIHYTEGEHDGSLFEVRSRYNDAPASVSVNTGGGDPDDFAINITGLDVNAVDTWGSANDDSELRFFPEGANRENEDTELALQFDLERQLNFGLLDAVQVGVKYRDREQMSFDTSGSDDDIDETRVGDDVFRQSDVDDFSFLVPDAGQVLNAILPLDTTEEINAEGFVLDADVDDFFNTTQDIWATYAMAKFDSENLSNAWPVRARGNVGLRYVRTERTTESVSVIEDPSGDIIEDLSTSFDFEHVLPSANLILDLRDDLLFRVSYSETISRPNPNDFKSSREVELDFDTVGGVDVLEEVEVDNGNPELEPFESDAIDISLEWYNREGSAITVAYFYKEVSGAIQERFSCPTSIAGLENIITGTLSLGPGGNPEEDCFDDAGVQYTVVDTVNSDGSFDLNGFEIGLLQNFDFLPAPWNGFGVQANYTYIDAGETIDEDGELAPVEEISEDTVNLIGYYETDRWGARLAYNYRSEYFTGVGRGTNDGDRTVDARGQVDFSANLNVTDQLSLGFEAFNLTDEPVFEYDGVEERLRNYANEGRTFVVSARYDF
ncbi:MAG: TonB-dependent receptor [Henriciella sp.]|nr:TonB-dependent receptor [Henriciella sp.]